MALKVLGLARVLRDSATGKLVVDKTTLRRGGSPGRRTDGEDDLGDDEDVGDDDSGDDDSEEVGDDDSGDLGDDEDLGEDDDVGDEDDLGEDDNNELAEDDLGVEADMDDEVSGRRGKRSGRRGGKKRPGQARRQGRREDRQERREDRNVKWGKTVLSGESNTPAEAGEQITITIRPQHWFRAQDITFTGDTAAKIDSIFFGAKAVWNVSVGVPVSVFTTSGMLRGLLRGQKVRPGLDIIIKGTSGANTKTTATLIGEMPMNVEC